MNHYGMIGTEGIDTCQDCLTYLTRIGPAAKRECHDCYYATEYGEPTLEPKLDAFRVEQVVVHRMSNMSAQEHEMLEQMSRRVNWLTQKKKAEPKPGYY